MQSFIVNVPDDKAGFFLQLIEQMDFEVIEIEEEAEEDEQRPRKKKKTEPEINDPFLDWEEERKNAKKNKY